MVRISLRYRHLDEVAVSVPSSKLYLELSQSARYYLDQVSHLEISPNINGTSTGVNQDSRFRAGKQYITTYSWDERGLSALHHHTNK